PDSAGQRKTIRVLDVVTGQEKYKGSYDAGVRTATLEPNMVVVVEPPDRLQMACNALFATFGVPAVEAASAGRVEVIDVRTGKKQAELATPEVIQPTKLFAIDDGSQLFVFISGESRQQPSRPIGPDYPVIEGQVYAFDRATGAASWPEPAVVSHRGAV